MDFYQLFFAISLIGFASYLIKYAADQFETAADFLGRNMPPGVKGATINAIGSSMPELLTSMAFIFTIAQLEIADGILAAVAVTAGSAVFNAVIIPALVILAVTLSGPKVKSISILKSTVIRDGVFLLLAEFILILALGLNVLTWWVASIMVGTYFLYFGYLMYQLKTSSVEVDDDDDEENEDDGGEDDPMWKRIVTLDFINIWFNGEIKNTKTGWYILGLSVAALAVACHLLAESVVMVSNSLSIPVYIASVILAAAATSVPDTVLSIKDAQKGNYDDAVANALGSNIFDITICTGLPILIYTLIFGSIHMDVSAAMADQVQLLRIVLFGVTAAILGMFLRTGKVGIKDAMVMLGMYGAWISWIIFTAIS